MFRKIEALECGEKLVIKTVRERKMVLAEEK